MKYPLFLSDFDGTLVRADGTVSDVCRREIENYRKAGGTFVIVTGRTLTSIRGRLKELGLTNGLVVAFQGAAIFDVAAGKMLQFESFTPKQAAKAISALEEENLHIQVYTERDFFCNCDDEGLRMYEHICGVKAEIISEPLSEKVLREGLRVPKVLTMVEKEERFALEARLKAKLGEEYYITRSADFLVEILPKHVSKGNAARFLSGRFHVPIEQVAAIGDNENDLPMILAVGGKFAVENADEALKQIARVVPSVEDDGVAAALKISMEETPTGDRE